MNNKLIILAVVFMFVTLTGLLPGVYAQLTFLGTFEQDREISLIQLCANCTFNNITSVISPNSTELIINVVMTRDWTNYNYTLLSNNTNGLGSYSVNGFGTRANIMTFDLGANVGRVGIGTSIPDQTLTVNGNINATNYHVQGSVGITGSCVAAQVITFVGGIAVSCTFT